jgi:spore germination protein KC
MIKVAVPNSDPKSPESKFLILTTNTNTITEGLSLMKSKFDLQLVFGHTSSIILGERIAKSNIQPLLEFFVRRPDFKMTSYLSVAKPNAFEVLNFKPEEEQIAGSILKSFFDYSKTESPYINTSFLFDAYRRETENGIDIAMPIIEANKTQLVVDKIALFNKYKMIMELNQNESEIYRLLTTGIYNGNLNIRNKDVMYAINLEKGKAKYKITDKKKKIKANYTIKVKAIVEEKVDGLGLVNKSEKSKIKKQVQDKLNTETINLLTKIKKNNIDPIGFGLRYLSRNSDKKTNQEWDNMYSNLKFDIKSTVEIEGTGLIN